MAPIQHLLPAVDPLVLLAVLLLVAGVVGSAIPQVPGPLLSLAGIGLYWWTATHPPGLVLAGFALVALLALAADWLAAPLAASAGGASNVTTLVASVLGLVGLVFGGPLVALLVVVGTVLILELRRHGDLDAGVRAALVTAVGIVGSIVVQVLLTAAVLVGVLAVILL
jgi:uncharacterized protein YqgC (DUF456 family)